MSENGQKIEEGQQATAVNLVRYAGPESLPSGSLLGRTEVRYPEESVYPLDQLVLEAAANCGVGLDDELMAYYSSSGRAARLKSGSRLASLIVGLERRLPKAFEIALEIDRMHPRIAWMRGGEIRIINGVAIIDRNIFADGLLGMNVESHVLKGANDDARANPAILHIDWLSLVQAAQAGLITIGTHHTYDICPSGVFDRPEQHADVFNWQKTHLKVFDCRGYSFPSSAD